MRKALYRLPAPRFKSQSTPRPVDRADLGKGCGDGSSPCKDRPEKVQKDERPPNCCDFLTHAGRDFREAPPVAQKRSDPLLLSGDRRRGSAGRCACENVDSATSAGHGNLKRRAPARGREEASLAAESGETGDGPLVQPPIHSINGLGVRKVVRQFDVSGRGRAWVGAGGMRQRPGQQQQTEDEPGEPWPTARQSEC